MRVIIKPVGLLSILVAFAVLGYIALAQSRQIETKKANASSETVAPQPSPTQKQNFANGNFENNFVPVVAYSDVGKPMGMVAAPWTDDSSWAEIAVDYSQETQNPHTGKGCQKIAVTNVATDKEARVQFIQEVSLDQKKMYRATCWIRADRTTEIDFCLRQKPWPYKYYGVNKVTLGQEWKQITVTGTPTADGNSMVMFKVSKPVTFWVDDVSLEPIPNQNL